MRVRLRPVMPIMCIIIPPIANLDLSVDIFLLKKIGLSWIFAKRVSQSWIPRASSPGSNACYTFNSYVCILCLQSMRWVEEYEIAISWAAVRIELCGWLRKHSRTTISLTSSVIIGFATILFFSFHRNVLLKFLNTHWSQMWIYK